MSPVPREHRSSGPVGRSLLPEEWRVQLPVFEGPLDLLLQLIKVNKVEITDIPVATICDQFHAYLELADDLDLDLAAEYIYEAALLIHLKSKLLLPRPEKAEGEPEEDPRQDLVARLLEYRRIKEAAQSLAEVDRLRMGVWPRQPQSFEQGSDEPREIDLGEVSLYDLLSAFQEVLSRFDRDHPPPVHVSSETFSIRHQIERLLEVMDRGRPYPLLDDLRLLSCRAEAIAAFLAVLELCRLGLARLHQTESGEILLYRTTRAVGADDLEMLEP